ncbi:hypothetical protein [Bradyrhizobium diazoefficiens]
MLTLADGGGSAHKKSRFHLSSAFDRWETSAADGAAGDVDGDGGVAPADSERGAAPVVTAWSVVVVMDHPERTNPPSS